MGERTHRYRCTHVVTTDYGDSYAAGGSAIAHLSVIPDGSHWQSRPTTFQFSVPPGTRPGAVWEVSFREIEQG